jgi:hypothetical protein
MHPSPCTHGAAASVPFVIITLCSSHAGFMLQQQIASSSKQVPMAESQAGSSPGLLAYLKFACTFLLQLYGPHQCIRQAPF